MAFAVGPGTKIHEAHVFDTNHVTGERRTKHFIAHYGPGGKMTAESLRAAIPEAFRKAWRFYGFVLDARRKGETIDAICESPAGPFLMTSTPLEILWRQNV